MKNEHCCSDAVPTLVAHRGASYYAPENTLPSYRLAWKEKADRIEGDFWLTADGRIVCLHDPTTERTAPGQEVVDVRDAHYPDLRQFDVGQWKAKEFTGTGIPTLDEILSEMPKDSRIYVEIKQDTPMIISTLLQVIADSPVTLDQVTLIAFSADIVRLAKQLVPQMTVFLLYDLEEAEIAGGTIFATEELLTLACSVHADGLGLSNSLAIDEHLVRRIREEGVEFHVWTVNDVQEALRYIHLGVDSITTDRPAGLRQEIIARFRQETPVRSPA